jgi:PKHD-type hydroxylase
MSHLPIWYLGQMPDEECDKASEDFMLINPKEATMGIEGEAQNKNTRNTTVRFCDKDHWFGLQMFKYGVRANQECKWDFLIDDHEAIQYAEYAAEQHYEWHVDTFYLSGASYDRKVTVVCLLNNPSEFEGGELKIRFNEEYSVPLSKGSIVAFPSFLEHKVTPIISGVRYTATMWLNGPRFR